MPSKPPPQIEVRFDLKLQKLMIRFWKENHAKDYEKKNTESHFLPEGGRCDVYLPIPSTMRYIRACSEEFAIAFTSAEAAKKWSASSILGHQRIHNKLEVSIKRNRTDSELNKLLAPDVAARLNVAKAAIKDDKLAPRHRDRSFSPVRLNLAKAAIKDDKLAPRRRDRSFSPGPPPTSMVPI
jgi:hypothetical protein